MSTDNLCFTGVNILRTCFPDVGICEQSYPVRDTLDDDELSSARFLKHNAIHQELKTTLLVYPYISRLPGGYHDLFVIH